MTDAELFLKMENTRLRAEVERLEYEKSEARHRADAAEKRAEQWKASSIASQAEAERMRKNRDEWTARAEACLSARIAAITQAKEPM